MLDKSIFWECCNFQHSQLKEESEIVTFPKGNVLNKIYSIPVSRVWKSHGGKSWPCFMKPTKQGNVICIACNSYVLYESCMHDVFILLYIYILYFVVWYFISCYIIMLCQTTSYFIDIILHCFVLCCIVFCYILLYIEMRATHTTYTCLHWFIHLLLQKHWCLKPFNVTLMLMLNACRCCQNYLKLLLSCRG